MIDTSDKTYVKKENIEGKTIKKFDDGYEEITLLFEDDTYYTVSLGVGNPRDI